MGQTRLAPLGGGGALGRLRHGLERRGRALRGAERRNDSEDDEHEAADPGDGHRHQLTALRRLNPWLSEDNLHKAHDMSLAFRFKPEGEAETAHVKKHIPEVQFNTAKGLTATLDYEKLMLSDWAAPIFFATVAGCRLEDHLGGKRLIIVHTPPGQKPQNRTVAHKDLKKEGADFLKTFELYYSRHMTAKQYLAQKALEDAEPAKA